MKTNRKIKIFDTNQKDCGMMPVTIEWHNGAPAGVTHKNIAYYPTNKTGTDMRTGELSIEMASIKDARLWISENGKTIWED